MQILNLFEGLSPNLNDDIVDLWDEVIPRLTAYLEKQSVSCVFCVCFVFLGGWGMVGGRKVACITHATLPERPQASRLTASTVEQISSRMFGVVVRLHMLMRALYS